MYDISKRKFDYQSLFWIHFPHLILASFWATFVHLSLQRQTDESNPCTGRPNHISSRRNPDMQPSHTKAEAFMIFSASAAHLGYKYVSYFRRARRGFFNHKSHKIHETSLTKFKWGTLGYDHPALPSQCARTTSCTGHPRYWDQCSGWGWTLAVTWRRERMRKAGTNSTSKLRIKYDLLTNLFLSTYHEIGYVKFNWTIQLKYFWAVWSSV